jgi:hypothetical protein
VYIADANNQRIRKITFHPETVNNIVNTKNNISIFPNPASNEITINAGYEIESITIINIVGQIVLKQLYTTATRKTKIGIGSLPNGIYFVKVNGVYAGKFVKE